MYYKRCTGKILVRKSDDSPGWVRWTHHAEGKTHCEECLKLDGCWFLEDNAPPCPHHPSCHCTLDPIDAAVVRACATAKSDYSKFVPYLFNTAGRYTHNKEKLFEAWGYHAEDALWLQAEIERQAREKYAQGDYSLGILNKYGQRINIRIEIPRKDGIGKVSFASGWTVHPNGQIKLNTPYGGK